MTGELVISLQDIARGKLLLTSASATMTEVGVWGLQSGEQLYIVDNYH